MQHLILALSLLISSIIFAKTSTKKIENEILVTVFSVNALSDNGTVKFAFYNEENFRKQPTYSKSASAKNGKSTVVFENVSQGIYAIICYHDENGMPKESYGLSNNVMTFSPPEFEVTEKDETLEIKF